MLNAELPPPLQLPAECRERRAAVQGIKTLWRAAPGA